MMSHHFCDTPFVADASKNPQDHNIVVNFRDDHFFRTAICVATPAFYRVLERQQFQSDKCS
ncbi:hypothetical protein [Mucilaginibacter gynuensis]|uniref:hypothetical protein n=1 Tax=Mucilaginibacter gynuensis TaxID=1302236 RepID=UPI0031F0965D